MKSRIQRYPNFPKLYLPLFFVFNFLLLSLPQDLHKAVSEELCLQGEAFCFADFALQDIFWINDLLIGVCVHIYKVLSCLLQQPRC